MKKPPTTSIAVQRRPPLPAPDSTKARNPNPGSLYGAANTQQGKRERRAAEDEYHGRRGDLEAPRTLPELASHSEQRRWDKRNVSLPGFSRFHSAARDDTVRGSHAVSRQLGARRTALFGGFHAMYCAGVTRGVCRDR